ncbi:hypothetical protein [Paraferrimonas haliotis]|uniref:Uncharacterized protein n=1 Tax=Paraferrimonas haliotis TaxID=2013866 RepID=A0AA37TL35_9GAMM|nr:hypothetical protein [Paraferrimonas haliotis]GLS83249.1 hypothetical protein GCM10007894_12260 [Paraferrimonas haliotis]
MAKCVFEIKVNHEMRALTALADSLHGEMLRLPPQMAEDAKKIEQKLIEAKQAHETFQVRPFNADWLPTKAGANNGMEIDIISVPSKAFLDLMDAVIRRDVGYFKRNNL